MRNLKQGLILGLSILTPVLITALLVLVSTAPQAPQQVSAASSAVHSTG